MADETVTTETTETTTETPSTTTGEPAKTETPASSDTEGGDKIDLGKGDEEDASAEGDAPKKGDEEDEQTDEEKARAALFGAPAEGETYAIEGLPEGMSIDEKALEAVTPTFRELGLSNAGASKVAGVYAEKVLPGVVEQVTAQQKEALETQIADQRNEWQGETLKAVKGEIELKTKTGDKIDFAGSSVKQVQQAAARAIDRVAPAGFREFLDETGLGMHPAMVAFAYKVGQLVSEDTDTGGGGGTPVTDKPTRTQKYYGR